MENEKCACQHCQSEQSPNAIYCYTCNYTDSCHKEVRNDWVFRRGYWKDRP